MTGYGIALAAGAFILLGDGFAEYLFGKMNIKSRRKFSKAKVRMMVAGAFLVIGYFVYMVL